jgi:hypothetical protein
MSVNVGLCCRSPIFSVATIPEVIAQSLHMRHHLTQYPGRKLVAAGVRKLSVLREVKEAPVRSKYEISLTSGRWQEYHVL